MTITGRTILYGLIAHPVAHVRAPTLFNPFLVEQGVDGVLVPVHVHPEGLADALEGRRNAL